MVKPSKQDDDQICVEQIKLSPYFLLKKYIALSNGGKSIRLRVQLSFENAIIII